MALRMAQQLCYLCPQDGIEFRGGDILISLDALLKLVNHFEGGLNAHIAGDEGFLKVVEHLIVHGRLAEDGLG